MTASAFATPRSSPSTRTRSRWRRCTSDGTSTERMGALIYSAICSLDGYVTAKPRDRHAPWTDRGGEDVRGAEARPRAGDHEGGHESTAQGGRAGAAGSD